MDRASAITASLFAALLSVGLAPPRAAATPADTLGAMRTLRLAGCNGHAGIQVALRSNMELNSAAAQWSRGVELKAAITRSGYREDQTAALHVSSTPQALDAALAQRLCAALTDASMRDAGVWQRGRDVWIIVAAPFGAPVPGAAENVAAEVLRLVNEARAAARHCGHSSMPSAPPLRLNELLNGAARAHAQDMLQFNYFDHTGHDGSSPAQRVAALGYGYRTVGENLASGPESAQEVVRGWLASPGHCQNIMDARFTDLGVAYAVSGSGEPRIYWVQEFGAAR